MPMAGSNATSQAVATGNTNNASTPTAGAGGGGPMNNNAAVPAVSTAKTWELSDYELHRTPQEAVTDGSEIAVSPRALHSELMCPICLDMLHNTMTTKECLHRFCSECIITALRSGNKECPTCRKKLVSKRSLRHDPNFDQLISKIYPSRDEYEAQQQKAMARLSKSHNQLALASSIEEGMKAQSQLQQQRKPKIPIKGGTGINGDGDGLNGFELNGDGNHVPMELDGPTNGTVKPASLSNASAGQMNPLGNIVPGSVSSAPATSIGLGLGFSANVPMVIGAGIGLGVTPGSSSPSHIVQSPAKISRSDSIGGESSNTSGYSEEVTEVELVFKPHPDMIVPNNTLTAQNQTRYIKTTANAWVEHLAKYLAMRLALDLDSQSEATNTSNLHNCTIYVSPTGGPLITIPQNQTLAQVCEKYWRFNKPLEMYYSWKKI